MVVTLKVPTWSHPDASDPVPSKLVNFAETGRIAVMNNSRALFALLMRLIAYMTVEALEKKIEELTLRLKQAEDALSSTKNITFPTPVPSIRMQVSLESGIHTVGDQNSPNHSVPAPENVTYKPVSVAAPSSGTLKDAAESSYTPIPDTADLNVHTQGWEYYGPSSPIAFLRKIPGISEEQTESYAEQGSRTFASLLHNSTFPVTPAESALSYTDPDACRERLYFRVSRKFIDAYFDNLHHIQPVLDQERFMVRCEELWFCRQVMDSSPFIALYYSVLSLGALLSHPGSGKFHGLEHVAWSRKLFKEACEALLRLGHYTNLDMVQCYYMMAKVAQHKLNPHITYLYTGQAVRIAISIGLNRESSGGEGLSLEAQQTWWSLYCLDVQTSFALGRPDGLGADSFHTCSIPGVESPSVRILPAMVSFSRIMRRTGSDLYAYQDPLALRLQKVVVLDRELEEWRHNLPPQYKEVSSGEIRALKSSLSVGFEEKQRIVVGLRYHNLRMVIHSSVINTVPELAFRANIQEHWQISVTSAMRTIDIIHETFLRYNFFQTWSYNSTYILFAVTILFIGVFHPLCSIDPNLVFGHVHQAIVVLDAVEETVVTRKAIDIIRETLTRAKYHRRHDATTASMTSTTSDQLPSTLSTYTDAAALPPITELGESTTKLDANDPDFIQNAFEFETSAFWAQWAENLGGVTDMDFAWP